MNPSESSAARADELFEAHRLEIFVATDRLFARLMVVQWLAAITAALVISPYTWIGQASEIHIHVWASLIVGGLITVFPVWLTRAWPGATITLFVIVVVKFLLPSVLISVTGEKIKPLFHVFGSLVIFSFYRDWRLLVPASIIFSLFHFLREIKDRNPTRLISRHTL